MPISLTRLTYGVALLLGVCPPYGPAPSQTTVFQPTPTVPGQLSYQIGTLPTFEGKRQVYAVSDSPGGLTMNLNIGGTHYWDFTTFPKSREAYKMISGGVPPRYEQFFKNTPLTLESNMASTGQLAKYKSHVFYDHTSTSIETRGLASVQHVPVFGIKEVIGIYSEPFDKWILFPLAVGNKWTDARDVRMKLIDPDGSKMTPAHLSCSVHSEREVADEGHILLNFEGNRQTFPCLVIHERVAVSCSNGSKVEHTYYWVNADLGFVAYVSGMENSDVPIFDRASGIASLLRIEGVTRMKRGTTKVQARPHNK